MNFTRQFPFAQKAARKMLAKIRPGANAINISGLVV